MNTSPHSAELGFTLYDLTGSAWRLDRGPCGEYGVWVDDDLVGSGASPDEALEDAVRTARGWS